MNFLRNEKDIPEAPIEFGDFKTGDSDPTTGCPIINVVFQTDKFIVTIDKSYSLNWYAEDSMNYAPDFGEVVSQVNLSEALVDRIFKRKNNLAYKKMLGEALSRLLDECNSTSAKVILVEAKQRIAEHCKVTVKMVYIRSSVVSVCFAGLGVILTLLLKEQLLVLSPSKDIYRLLMCTFLGGLGAFINAFARFQNYEGSIVSGLGIHRLDGFLRIFYGLICGIIIALAVKGNMLAGFAADDTRPWILYFLAMVAGASEVLIPNLVKQAEGQVSFQKPVVTKTENPTTENKKNAVPDDQILPVAKDVSLHGMSVKAGIPDDAILEATKAELIKD